MKLEKTSSVLTEAKTVKGLDEWIEAKYYRVDFVTFSKNAV